MVTKIKEIRLARLNNAEYTQFMSNVEGLITTAGVEKLGVEMAMFKDFKDTIVKLTDLAKQSRTSKETQELETLDKQRDELVVYLLSTFRNERKSPLDPRKEAATALHTLTKPYVGIQSLPHRQETQHIEGLITDLAKPENTTHITTLGLTEAVDKLNKTNAKYKQLTADRTETHQVIPVESAKKLRLSTDEQYDEMTTRAFAHSVALGTAEAVTFVNSLNRLIEDTNIAYKQRVAQMKHNKTEPNQ